MKQINKGKKTSSKKGKTVYVDNDNIDKAIKKFRRVITDNNIMVDFYKNRFFIKKSVLKRKKQSLKNFKIKCWIQKQKLLQQEN